MLNSFLFAGGGTGGHLTPGLAVAAELSRRDPTCRIVFVGTDRPLESRILAGTGYEHRALPVESARVLLRKPWRFFWRNYQAFRLARSVLDEVRPVGVIGLGGFASVPTVWHATQRRIPTVLLEGNAIPGRANRLLCRRAQAVCAATSGLEQRLPAAAHVCETGNPLRPQFADLWAQAEHVQNVGPHTLLVLGGSLGAEGLNRAVVDVISRRRSELAGWRIVHQTGAAHFEETARSYAAAGIVADVQPFFDDLPRHYGSATLAVTRAGAGTLAELACAGLPAILLPYPQAVDQHQLANARIFEQAGAAVIVEHAAESTVTAERLDKALQSLILDLGRQQTMRAAMRRLARPDAARRVADVLLAYVHPKVS